MTSHVFTYGSLMFDDVWCRVVSRGYRSVAASLVHHVRYAIDGETYPGVVVRDGARVDGVLHLDVEADDLTRLDDFEGDDYLRSTVTVDCADGIARSAEVYVYRRIERLLAASWEPDAFAMQRFLDTFLHDRLDR